MQFHTGCIGGGGELAAQLPVGGDALTVIAGVMRVRFDLFVLLTAIGKCARYLVLIFVIDQSFG